MIKEKFIEQINLMQEFNHKIDQIQEFGIDLVDTPLFDIPAKMFDNFIDSICTEDGGDIVYWWMYEDCKKVVYETLGTSEEKQEIPVETVEQLYDYLLKNEMFLI